MQDVEWGQTDAKGHPIGDGCLRCMTVACKYAPDLLWASIVVKIKSSLEADKQWTLGFFGACEMYDLLGESHQNLAFAPASNVNSQTTYGIRIFQEIPLASDSDVLRLVGRSASSLKLTPMKVKLEGDNSSFSNLYPLSMEGLTVNDILPMKRMMVFYDTAVEHEQDFVTPASQLFQEQGHRCFDFITDQHFQLRHPAAKLSGKPPTVQDLKEKAQQIESALPKQAARPGLTAAERADELEESESASENEDDADAEGEGVVVRRQVKGRQAPTLGLTAVPAIAKAKAKAVGRKAGQEKASVRGNQPAPPSPRASSATAKGSVSKKDKENERWLEQLSGDETLFQAAKKHLASDTGSSIKCLAALNLAAFFATPKMGQTLNGVIVSDWGNRRNLGHRKTSLRTTLYIMIAVR